MKRASTMMGEEKEGVLIIEGYEREGEARGTDTGDTEAPCLLPLRQICRFRVACAWHDESRGFRNRGSVWSRNEKVFSSLLSLSRGENQNALFVHPVRASFPCFVRVVSVYVYVYVCICGIILATSSLVCRSENSGDEDLQWSGVVASSALASSLSRFEAGQEGITIVDC